MPAFKQRNTVSSDPVARLAEAQTWIHPEWEESLQQQVRSLLDKTGGEPLRSFLHGDWLHEPLHAILTDIPVGSWTAAFVFDAIAAFSPGEGAAGRTLDSAADGAVLIGLLGAAAAAVAGWNDWSEIRSEAPRKIGIVHGLLNVAATGIYAGSLCARARRNRSAGRWLGLVGYGLVSLSAHLGGNLVYEHRVGVRGPQRELW